ncbi:MAG: hypothetical protein ACO3JL_06390 [Myxococcota bacterium]
MHRLLRPVLFAPILLGLSFGCVSVSQRSEVVPGMAGSFAPLPRRAYLIHPTVTGSATVTVRRSVWQKMFPPLFGRSVVTGDHAHETRLGTSTEMSIVGQRMDASPAAGSQIRALMNELSAVLGPQVATSDAVTRATEAAYFRALEVIPGADFLLEPRASVSLQGFSSSFLPLTDTETATVIVTGKAIALHHSQEEPAPTAVRPSTLPLETPKVRERELFVELGPETLRWVVTRRHPGDAVELDLVILDDEKAKSSGEGAPFDGTPAVVQLSIAGESRSLEVRAPVTLGADLGIGYVERYRFELPRGQTALTLSVDDTTRRVGARLHFSAVPAAGLEDELAPLDEETATATDKASDPVSVEAAAEEPAPEEEKGPFPYRFSAQVGAGGAVQLGGLTPLLPSGSLRVGVGRREGWASPFALALGFDFDHQSASTTSGVRPSARWGAMASRLRGEAEWRPVQTMLGPLPLDVTVLGGIGAVIGQHAVTIGTSTSTALLLGPTFRLGAEVGLGLGPGALILRAPVDVSWDLMTSPARNFMPLAAGLSLGYRLDL